MKYIIKFGITYATNICHLFVPYILVNLAVVCQISILAVDLFEIEKEKL